MNIFDRVKEIPIEDVVSKYLPDLEFGTSGRWQMTRCPFHEDSDPSFGVNPDTNSWHCFGCDKGGSVIDLVMNVRGLEALEAAKELARVWGIPFQELTPEEKVRQQEFEGRQQLLASYITWAQKQLGPEQREALHKRGLDDQAIKEFRIGYDPRRKDFRPPADKLPNYERLGFFNASGYVPAGRIVLPYFEYGKPVYVQFWDWNQQDDPGLKYLNPSGWQKRPVGFDLICRDKPVYLVEGAFDWFSIRQAGYVAVCTLGTSVNREHQERLRRANQVYILFDNDSQKADNPGQKAAMGLLREMYPKARNILLPDGKDPNDCYRENPEGFRELIDRLTSQARDALSLAFERLDSELAKQESKTKIATDEIKAIWQEITFLIASVNSSIERDALARYFHEKLKPLGVRKSAIEEEIDAAVKTFRQKTEETTGGEEEEPEPLAVFPGLVDIVEVQETVETEKGVETKTMPAFMMLEDGQLRVTLRYVVDGRLVCPPPRDDKHKIPWLLPRAAEVIRYYREDDDSRLYDDLLVYLKDNSEMPDEKYYDLLAAWVFHTYLLEKFQYSPYLWFFAVWERGKSRTGKGLIYVAYRGVHVESLRDAYIVRLANDWQATIFFDVIDLWKKAEKTGTEDVIMNRFERGTVVPRVNYPDRGPYRDVVYYNIFGPTVVATNVPIGAGLNTRAIQINMPESVKSFNNEIKPELSLPLKERLVAFRARHLNEELPDIPKPAFKRLGDITRPLLQVIRLVKPEREPILRELIAELEEEKRKTLAESLDAKIIEALFFLRKDDKVTFRDGKEAIVLDDLAEIMNAGRPEKNQLSNRYLGSKLRALGFTFLGRQPGTGKSIYELNGKLMELLAIRYGLKEAKKESQEIPSYTQEYASQTSQPSQTRLGQGFQGVKIGVKMCEDSPTFTDKNCEDSPTFTNLHSNLHSQEPHKYCTCEQCEDCEDNTRVRTGVFPADIFEGEI